MTKLRRSFLILAGLFFYSVFPVADLAQDLTVAQRKERCQNNKVQLAELQNVARELTAMLPWPDDKLAKAKTTVESLDQRWNTNNPKYRGLPSGDEARRISSEWGFDLDSCLAPLSNDKSFNEALPVCLGALQSNINMQIGVNSKNLERIADTEVKLAELNNKIYAHLTNLTALGCDDFTAEELKNPTAKSWVWERVGTGDYAGSDVGSSDGFIPVAGMAKAGWTAVCWDDQTYKNGGKVWCTYKNVAPEKFYQGPRTGVLYKAVPK